MKQRILSFICLLIAIQTISAQFYSLNLPFVKESPEPELFLFEPHYDAQNKVTHYTLGDLLKIEYTREDSGISRKKISYKWDRYDLAWEKNDETTFKYDDSGRLTEERTEMLYPKIELNNISYIKATIVLRQISYDPISNTDTICEFINVPQVGHYSGYSDSTYTIRYLNKNNLPDSVIMEKRYMDYFVSKQKSIYKYDNKKRNILTEVFYQNNYTPWRKSYTIDTKYEKDKITYTQTPEPLTEEEIEILKEEYNEDWKDFYDTSPVVFSITFDKKNRIASKKLTFGTKNILNAKYTYNQQGKTLVEHEQTMDNRLFGQVRGFGASIPDELKYLKYTVHYPNESCSQSVYYNKNEEGKLQKIINIKNCYSSEGKQISNDMTRYELEDGEFNDRKIIETTYSEDGLSGEIVEYRTHWEENATDLLNNPDEKIIFRNDENGRRIYEEKHNYYSSDNTWYPESKKYSDYDENGFETRWEEWDYSGYNKKWEAKYCYSYVRDSLNRVLLQEEKIWRNNEWKPYNRECFAYNDLNNKTLTEEYKWIDSENYWKGIGRDSTVYDAVGEVLEEIDYRWSDEQRAWQPREKTNYENTEKSKVKTRFFWKNDTWHPVWTSFNGRLADEPDTWRKSYSVWDDSVNDWRTESLEKDTRINDSTTLNETYWWNNDLNSLEGWQHILTENLSNHVAEARSESASLTKIEDIMSLEVGVLPDEFPSRTVRKTYSLWNYDTNDWKSAIRHTEKSQGKEQEFIFENYDNETSSWISDKKALLTTNDSIEHVVYYSWNKTTNGWTENRKQVYYYSDGKNAPVREEYFEYDKSKSDWFPVCYGEKNSYNGKEAFQYFQWDKKRQSWTPYFMKTGSGWNVSFYAWSSDKQVWNEVDYYKHDEFINQLDAYFKADYEVDYGKMIDKNRQSK